jgi:hypothetical protein
MMCAFAHTLRRSILLWGAVCVFALPVFAQTPPTAHFTVKMPDLPGEAAVDADTSAIVCRPPQPQSDSRLLGPKVCRTQRQWDELHSQGLDIGADGKSIVASEKVRSLRACGTATSCN